MKKVLALALALSLLLCFAGCEKKTSSDGEIPTLKWYVPGDSQPGLAEVLEKANEISVKEIGAKLDIQFIDTGSFNERMRMIMAAQEVYDLCFTGYLNVYTQAAQMGGLEELDELLKTTPDLVESVEDFFWEGSMVNGELYAVPNQQVVSQYMLPFVKKDLADKYGLDTDSITNHKQLEPFLEKVLQGENGIYPWRMHNSYFKDGMEFEEFKIGGVGYRTDSDKVEIIFNDTQPEWMEGLKTRHEWFKKGYVRPDVLSVGDDTTDYNAGKYAMDTTPYKPGQKTNLEQKLGYEVEFLMNMGHPFVGMNSITATMIGISPTSKNKEKAIKLIELLNTNKEYYNLICYGIEGKHYEFLEDNSIRYIDGSNYYPNASWKFGNQFNAYVVEGMGADVWEQTIKMNNEAEKSKLMGFVLDTSNIESEIAQCETVRNQYGTAYFKGAVSSDDGYDDYLKRMKTAGIDKILAEVQRQVDEFLASKK